MIIYYTKRKSFLLLLSILSQLLIPICNCLALIHSIDTRNLSESLINYNSDNQLIKTNLSQPISQRYVFKDDDDDTSWEINGQKVYRTQPTIPSPTRATSGMTTLDKPSRIPQTTRATSPPPRPTTTQSPTTRATSPEATPPSGSSSPGSEPPSTSQQTPPYSSSPSPPGPGSSTTSRPGPQPPPDGPGGEGLSTSLIVAIALAGIVIFNCLAWTAYVLYKRNHPVVEIINKKHHNTIIVKRVGSDVAELNIQKSSVHSHRSSTAPIASEPYAVRRIGSTSGRSRSGLSRSPTRPRHSPSPRSKAH